MLMAPILICAWAEVTGTCLWYWYYEFRQKIGITGGLFPIYLTIWSSLAREHGQGARQKKVRTSRNRSALLRERDTPARSGHFTASFIR